MATIVSDNTLFQAFLVDAACALGSLGAELADKAELGADIEILYHKTRTINYLIKSIEDYVPGGESNCLTPAQVQTLVDKLIAECGLCADCSKDSFLIPVAFNPFVAIALGIIALNGDLILTIGGQSISPI